MARLLTIALLLWTLLISNVLPAEEPKSTPCSSAPKREKGFWESLPEAFIFLLFPAGDLNPPSWIAKEVHRVLLAWDRFRAERGSVSAAYEVGRALYFGLGTPPNEAEGLKWLLTAADQGDLLARYTIAAIGFCRYVKRPVVPGEPFAKLNYPGLPEKIRQRFNEEQCRIWLAEAVEAGYPKAIRLRAFIPEKEPANEVEGLKSKLLWLEKARVAGDPFAEACGWDLIGFEPPKRGFFSPKLVWTARGTP